MKTTKKKISYRKKWIITKVIREEIRTVHVFFGTYWQVSDFVDVLNEYHVSNMYWYIEG